MPPNVLLFEVVQQVPNTDLSNGIITGLAVAWVIWISIASGKNWRTPTRLDKVEDIKTDIATMKKSVEHLSGQIDRVYDHIMKAPPRPEGPKPHPTIDPDK